MVGTTNKSKAAMCGIAQEGTPALTARAAVYLGHVLGDGRLSHRETELEQSPWMRGALSSWQDPGRAVRDPQVIVAALADVQQPRFSIAHGWGN
jgi:hypothetical protein